MAYDPTTPHSLLSRGEAIAKHIGSVVVGLGHDLVLEVERLVGLVPKPEPVAAAPAPQQDPEVATLQAALDQLHQERGRIDDLLAKAVGKPRPADQNLPDYAAGVIDSLQTVAIDRGDRVIALNTDNDGLKARVTELEGGLATAIAAGTAAAEKLAQAATDLAAKDATIATLETSVADLKKGPFPPPASTVVDDAAPAAAPEGAAVETAPGVVADVTETVTAAPSRETPVT